MIKACIDSLTGLYPCRILAVTTDRKQALVSGVAEHGPYRKGTDYWVPVAALVAPSAVVARGFSRRILTRVPNPCFVVE